MARTRPGGGTVGSPSEHPEIIGYDFKAGALLSFFILPLARLNTAFNENQRTLLQVLLRDFGLLAPYDDLMPLGALLAFAALVFVRLIGGQREIGNSLAASGIARFGISSEPSHENNFVD